MGGKCFKRRAWVGGDLFVGAPFFASYYYRNVIGSRCFQCVCGIATFLPMFANYALLLIFFVVWKSSNTIPLLLCSPVLPPPLG